MNTVAGTWPPIPMAAYGPGDGTLDHGNEEHITIAEYLHGVTVLTAALSEMTTD
ncbi:hypothetical protein [Fodinicola feengrottensis]|nr:hypothetical protein [Fodinicola feengrottensis]